MRLATALTVSLLAAPAAMAADFPVLRGSQQPDYAPRFESAGPDWSGFYIGGTAGYSDARFGKYKTPNDIVAQQYRNTALQSEAAVSTWLNLSGGPARSGVYGAFAGYNWAFGDAVFGLEADISKISIKNYASDTVSRIVSTSNGYLNSVTQVAEAYAQLDGYGTFRARAGWNAGFYMPYITAGVAVGRGKFRSSVTSTLNATDADPASPPVLPDVNRVDVDSRGNSHAYTVGGTVGAGVDMLLANNVLLRGEYQFVRFGSVSGLPIDVHVVRGGVGVKF